jgi:hypothetical protein
MKYGQKLQDPRWKLRRQEILQRDSFTCTRCKTNSNLQVHHIKYTGDPWEAPDKDLVTLCAVCHKAVHGLKHLGSFIMAYQYALEKVGKEAPHTGNTLLRLLARVEQENQLFFHSPTLSAELNIPRTTLENHFRKLLEIGAIVPDPKQENNSRGIVLWRVCPYLVWSGTGEKMRDYLASLPATHPFHSFQDPNIAGA